LTALLIPDPKKPPNGATIDAKVLKTKI